MTAPKTIRDLVRDLSGFDDVDDAIRAVITEDITLLSPGFVLSRESMIEAQRRLSSNDFDIVSYAEFVAVAFSRAAVTRKASLMFGSIGCSGSSVMRSWHF